MARRHSIRLDSAGVRQVLRSAEVRDAVTDAAHGVAATVIGRLPPDVLDGVVVDDYTTDRAAASVTIRDPRARLWEARDGILTGSALAEGLDVGGR